MNRPNLIVSLVVLAVAAGVVGYSFVPRSVDSPFDLAGYAKLPVQHGGRIKPMDSVARTALLLVSDKRTYLDEAGRRQPAIRFLLDLQTVELGNPAFDGHRVIRIDNDALIDAIGLEPRPGFRYAMAEVRAVAPALIDQIRAAMAMPEDQRTLYHRKVLELSSQLDSLTALSMWSMPGTIPPPPPPPEVQAGAQGATGRGAAAGADWQTLADGLHQEHATGERLPLVDAHDRALTAWTKGDAPAFNAAVADCRRLIRDAAPDAVRRAGLEYRFNAIHPLLTAAGFYVAALLLVAAGWLGRWRSLMTGAAALVVFTLILHTAALGMRMYLQGRPPVTNLYSSAVFVGWGAVVLALALELLYRNGIGTMMAAVTGFLSLVIAINLELSANGETLDVMQAVLDTNFWLATHVTTVTIGYSATFLAGMLGIVYILGSTFTRRMDADAARSLGRMIYGVICFALLFSFVGTVLGGIWADQSWGRFWGWDPKENGALIIVLWNALILHARWGGLVRQRGIATLAVFGNIVTAWSWFGVNMLGVGLHSYGFMESAAFWMMIFVASQLLIIGVGLVPPRRNDRRAAQEQPRVAAG